MAYGTLHCVELSSAIGKRDLYLREGTSDEGAIKQIFEEQQYAVAHLFRAQEIFDFLKRKTDSGQIPLIIDAGANIGAASVYFAINFSQARIVAIEPEASNFAVLQKNVAGLNVRCVHAALASSPGFARVVDPGDGHWGFRTETSADSSGVPRVTIPDIYAQELGPNVFPFLVKLDIEGGEADLFSANTEWFDQTPFVMIELHDWLLPKGGTAAGFLKIVAGKNRDFLIRGENIYSIAHELG